MLEIDVSKKMLNSVKRDKTRQTWQINQIEDVIMDDEDPRRLFLVFRNTVYKYCVSLATVKEKERMWRFLRQIALDFDFPSMESFLVC